MSGYKPPGRLGDPDMELHNEPRLHTKLVKVLAAVGLDRRQPAANLTVQSPISDLSGAFARSEEAIEALYAALPNELPSDVHDPQIERSEVKVKGLDGNGIALHIFRRAGTAGHILPCVIYTHGGGMTTLSTTNKVHTRWLTSLAVAGVVAVGIDFRNAYTKAGHNPFPAGLNDCVAGVQYVAAHKTDLGIGQIVLQGESGGCNLACATALRANREGWIGSVAGVYGVVPFISGAWGWSQERLLQELPSCIENDEYFLAVKGMALMGHYYTPTEADKTNPLAWPYYATTEDLKGLPPHYLMMDELDPLRDEGVAYYKKLSAAGVPVTAHVNLGTVHGSALIFRQALPEYHIALVESIAAFAKGLGAARL